MFDARHASPLPVLHFVNKKTCVIAAATASCQKQAACHSILQLLLKKENKP